MLKIKDLRIEKGWTQKELAERIQTSNKNVWAWENKISSPDIETLIVLAKVFEVTVDYLIGNSDDFGVVTIAPNSAELSADEKEVIKKYRALSLFQQEAIRIQLDAMSEKVTRKSFFTQVYFNKITNSLRLANCLVFVLLFCSGFGL